MFCRSVPRVTERSVTSATGLQLGVSNYSSQPARNQITNPTNTVTPNTRYSEIRLQKTFQAALSYLTLEAHITTAEQRTISLYRNTGC